MKISNCSGWICKAVFLVLVILAIYVSRLHAQVPGNFFKPAPLPGSESVHRIKLMPIGVSLAYGRANTSFGCAYEYLFNKEDGIGLYMPFVYGYRGMEQQLYNEQIRKLGQNYILGIENTSWYIAPGVQLHTSARQRKVEFATGAGLVLGNLKTVYYFNSPTYPYKLTSTEDNYGLLGVVLDNSVDYTHGHLIAGLSVRFGMLAEEHDIAPFLFAAGLHLGLRM